MNTTNKKLKNPFKVGDTVIYHSELCDKSFYSDAKKYCEQQTYKLVDKQECLVIELRDNIGKSGCGNFIKIDANNNYNLPYDVFTLKKEEFVLPEKWCISQYLDVKLIGDWFNENNDTSNTSGIYSLSWPTSHYFHHPKCWRNSLTHYVPFNGYTKITLEQFKKYVLKETIKEDKTMRKQEFSIEGSIGLRKAFIEESDTSYFNDNINDNLLRYDYLCSASSNKKFSSTTHTNPKHFILPEDWNEAMVYVKEYFKDEEIIDLKIGDHLFITKRIESNSCIDDVVKVICLEKESSFKGHWVRYKNITTQRSGGFRQSAYVDNFRIATVKEIADKTPTSKMFKLGAYQAEVKQKETIIDGKGYVINMDIMEFYAAYRKGKLSFELSGFSMKPQAFSIGCVENIPIKDILEVCEYIEKNELG